MSHVTMSIVKCDIFFLPLVLEIDTINFAYKRAVWHSLHTCMWKHISCSHPLFPSWAGCFERYRRSWYCANNMQSRTHKKVCVTWINSFRTSYGFFFLAFTAFQLWAFCELTLEAICSLSLWSVIVIVQQSKQLSCIFFFRRKFKFFS